MRVQPWRSHRDGCCGDWQLSGAKLHWQPRTATLAAGFTPTAELAAPATLPRHRAVVVQPVRAVLPHDGLPRHVRSITESATFCRVAAPAAGVATPVAPAPVVAAAVTQFATPIAAAAATPLAAPALTAPAFTLSLAPAFAAPAFSLSNSAPAFSLSLANPAVPVWGLSLAIGCIASSRIRTFMVQILYAALQSFVDESVRRIVLKNCIPSPAIQASTHGQSATLPNQAH